MKTAIITGITGQDGAYLAKHLLSKRYYVIGLLRDNLGINIKNLKYLEIDTKINFKKMDPLNLASMVGIIKNNKIDEIYSLATQSSVGLHSINKI